jgi:hypothetical protein
MNLLVVYTVFVAIGESAVYGIGRVVEAWSPSMSLPVFLAGFFFVLWLAWRAAIRVT